MEYVPPNRTISGAEIPTPRSNCGGRDGYTGKLAGVAMATLWRSATAVASTGRALGLRLCLLTITATFSGSALADVANLGQDESLARTVSGPVERFTSTWKVRCASGARRCTIELETLDRLGPGHTRTLLYPFRVTVEPASNWIDFPTRETEIPAGRSIDLVIDNVTAATVMSGEKLADPKIFDWMFRSVELQIASGRFADPPRLRSFLILEGLQDAIEEAEAKIAAMPR